jgi:hypothetical protein
LNGPNSLAQPYTQEQHEQFLENLRQYGNEPMAAHASLLPLNYVRLLRQNDDQFDVQCEEALELHAGLLYANAVKKATAEDGSDLLLGRLLEAKVPGFSKEARVMEIKKIGMPRQLRLRSFVESDGAVTEVTEKSNVSSGRNEDGAAAAVPRQPRTGQAPDADDLSSPPLRRGAAGGSSGHSDPGHREDVGVRPATWNGI